MSNYKETRGDTTTHVISMWKKEPKGFPMKMVVVKEYLGKSGGKKKYSSTTKHIKA